MPPGFGVMMGHEASTLASEYGPQCMNMPNLAFRYQAVRSSKKIEANAALGSSGSEPMTAASLRKSRRLLPSLYARQLSEAGVVFMWAVSLPVFDSKAPRERAY